MRQDQNYMAIVSATGSTRFTMHLHRVDVLQQGCIFSLILQLLRSIYSMYQVALSTLKEMLIYCDNNQGTRSWCCPSVLQPAQVQHDSRHSGTPWVPAGSVVHMSAKMG